MQCGWLTDRYGVSWPIVPEILDEPLQDEGPEKSNAVMTAMMKLVKLHLKKLPPAYDRA